MAMTTIDQVARFLALQHPEILDKVAIKMVELNQPKAEAFARSIQIEIMDLEYRDMEQEDEGLLYDEF